MKRGITKRALVLLLGVGAGISTLIVIWKSPLPLMRDVGKRFRSTTLVSVEQPRNGELTSTGMRSQLLHRQQQSGGRLSPDARRPEAGASGDILPEEVPPVFVEPLRLIRSLEDRALRDGNDDLLRMVKVEKEKIVMAMGEWKAGEQ